MKRIFLAGIILIALSSGSSQAMEWEIDPTHSTIGFSVKHMMVSTVRGSFNTYTSDVIKFDPVKPRRITGSVEIDVASINTNNKKRDDHLLGSDFFEAEKHPKISFTAKKSRRVSTNEYQVKGDLTIKGVTKEVTLEANGFTAAYKNPWGKTVTAVSLKGAINREDFGLTWNMPVEGGGFIVSKEVMLEIDLELIKKQ